MSNWLSSLERVWRAFCQSLFGFLARLRGEKKPYQRLARTCETLQQQLGNPQTKERAWQTYAKALSLAQKCDRAELSQLVFKFDPLLSEPTSRVRLAIEQAISFLLKAKPQTSQNLDASWRLSKRLEDSSSMREIQQNICLQGARLGDVELLLAKLLERHGDRTLTTPELEDILNVFLEARRFQWIEPWKAFFKQLKPEELPQIHQVYAVLDRYLEAADLAEAAKDYRSAIDYLMPLTGKDIAFRTLTLSNRLGDEKIISRAHQKMAESFWQEENWTEARLHFQKANNLEGVSNCYQKLGDLALAIQFRPNIRLEWIQTVRNELETQTRSHLDRQDFAAAAGLLKSVAGAWQEKSQAAEAERTQHLLAEAVRTARSALSAELENQAESEATDLFKRWSLIEEAAGNYLEAGLQAEKARDYFTASVLFEKAEAFGQALEALESASAGGVDSRKRAQLLERGGDFFRAALVYERLGETDRAIALYEKAGEFLRGAELRRCQLGNDRAAFDPTFQGLLTKAGQLDRLAELCASQASLAEQSTDRIRLWRRIKELAEPGWIGQKWLDRVAIELPEIELLDRRRFEERAGEWMQTATREVLADYSDAIGLDLGTSNSVVCLYDKQQGQAEVVEWHRRRQIPSVLAIDRSGQEWVGIPIPELLSKSPRAIITKVKREMGTNRKFKVGNQQYRPEEISARIINHARQFAREYLQKKIAAKITTISARAMGVTPPNDWTNEFLERHPPSIPLSNIVITVPAYFNEAQKQATKTAAVLADMQVLRLIHEPTAACLTQHGRQTKETILVVDLGAGTLDLSIIESGEGMFEVLEIEGDNSLGSADVDEILYNHFSEFVKRETAEEIPYNSQAATRLRQACEELKIELSSQSEWGIDLPYLVGDRSIRLTLTRTELEHLSSPWLERIRRTCQKLQHKPDRILLIGGGGLMPAVPRCIQEVFNRDPDSAYDPLTVVARGAALQAAILLGDLENKLLLDAVPFSLGIKCRPAPGEFKFDCVIAKHTTIPAAKTERYTTAEDGQTNVKIEIFQGESPLPEENFKIGEFILQGIYPAPAGVPQIDVKFDIDANCLLTVTARDAATGQQQSIEIADSHLLTPAQTTSLKTKFRGSQLYQESLTRLKKRNSELKTILQAVEKVDLPGLSARFQDRMQIYEGDRGRYSPTPEDSQKLAEIYSDRPQIEEKTRLVLDRWGTLSQSIRRWLDNYGSLDWRSEEIEIQILQYLEESDRLLERARDAKMDGIDIAAHYQKWLNALENLPINPEGDSEELARYFLSLQRYSEALAQFQRLATPLAFKQVELGLEIFARARQREAYQTLLLEHQQTLGICQPDFNSPNHAVRIYSDSVVCLQVNLGGRMATGSGFAIAPTYIATNRHVLIDETTGKCVAPEAVRVVTGKGDLSIVSIHLPAREADDVAIVQLSPDSTALTPLWLGFSELVEVGERIMTLGFPAPESGGFTDNLYCNAGLINRIRPSHLCSERVLEISIPIQGGISGAPIFNKLGEVVGLLTFSTIRRQELGSGQIRSEQSFYAIPVELLRRLRAEMQ